jgi:hypothetical protein
MWEVPNNIANSAKLLKPEYEEQEQTLNDTCCLRTLKVENAFGSGDGLELEYNGSTVRQKWPRKAADSLSWVALANSRAQASANSNVGSVFQTKSEYRRMELSEQPDAQDSNRAIHEAFQSHH